jgi:hypothetical protein
MLFVSGSSSIAMGIIRGENRSLVSCLLACWFSPPDSSGCFVCDRSHLLHGHFERAIPFFESPMSAINLLQASTFKISQFFFRKVCELSNFGLNPSMSRIYD